MCACRVLPFGLAFIAATLAPPMRRAVDLLGSGRLSGSPLRVEKRRVAGLSGLERLIGRKLGQKGLRRRFGITEGSDVLGPAVVGTIHRMLVEWRTDCSGVSENFPSAEKRERTPRLHVTPLVSDHRPAHPPKVPPDPHISCYGTLHTLGRASLCWFLDGGGFIDVCGRLCSAVWVCCVSAPERVGQSL